MEISSAASTFFQGSGQTLHPATPETKYIAKLLSYLKDTPKEHHILEIAYAASAFF